MSNLSQQQIEDLIQFISNTEEPGSVTNLVVGAVLAYLLSKAPEPHSHSTTDITGLKGTIAAAFSVYFSNGELKTSALPTDFLTQLSNMFDGYATIGRSKLLNLLHSRIMLLDSMGQQLDGTPYTYEDGDLVWSPGEKQTKTWNGSSFEGGETYPPRKGVVFINKHTGKCYMWDGSSMVEIGSEGNDIYGSIWIHKMDQTDVANIPNGQIHFMPSTAKLVYRISSEETISWTPKKHLIYVGIPSNTLYRWTGFVFEAASSSVQVVNSLASNETDKALSAKMGHDLLVLIQQIYNALGNYAFPDGKPELNWVGTFIQHTLSYDSLNGCTANVEPGLVNEGLLRITLTPTTASMAFTSVLVNGEAHAWTPSGESDGSIYLDVIVNQDIHVSATAVEGYSVTLDSNSSNVTLVGGGAQPNRTYQCRIVAAPNYSLPTDITATMNGEPVSFAQGSGNSYSQQGGEIVIANVTGPIVIFAEAVEQAHLTLSLPNDANIVCKHGTDVLGSSVTVYSGMMPYNVTIEPAEGCHFTNVPSVGGTALPNTGEVYTLTILAGSTNDITVTASAVLANALFRGVRYGEGQAVGSLNYLYVGEYEPWAISPLIDVTSINTIKFATGGSASTFAGLVTFDANKKPLKRAGTIATEPRTLVRDTDAGFPLGTKYVRLQMPIAVLAEANVDAYITDGNDNDLWRLSDYTGGIATPDDFLASEYNPYPAQSDGSWLGWFLAEANKNTGWSGSLNDLGSNGQYTKNPSMVARPGKATDTPLALGLSPKIAVTPTVNVKYGGEVISTTDNTVQGSLCVHLSSGKADLFMQKETPRTSGVSKAGTTHVQLMFRAVVTNGVYSVSVPTYVDVGADGDEVNNEWHFVNPSNNE